MTITLEDIKKRHDELGEMIATLDAGNRPFFEYQDEYFPLNQGELYVGTIITPGEYGSYHLILLPGHAESVNWEAATEWATEQGGELPNRIEQAMLWANFRDQLQKDWYWSNEIYQPDDDYAWVQDFDDGYQYDNHKDNGCRARAVRRLVLQ